MTQDLIDRIMAEGLVEDRHFAEQLLRSFSWDLQNPHNTPDLQRGYNKAAAVVGKLKAGMKSPQEVLYVTPFSHAYLGKHFELLLDTILERAKTHPGEEEMLHQVLTGAALVRPELRDKFVETIRATPRLDLPMYMDLIISSTDPEASFSGPDEFPYQFHTSEVGLATDLLGVFLERDLFHPETGFSKKYNAVLASMGSLDYMLKTPSNTTLVVSSEGRTVETIKGALGRLHRERQIEVTPNIEARPENNGENPSLVIVNGAVPVAEVAQWYRQSTLLYYANSGKQADQIKRALGTADQELLFDGSTATNPERFKKLVMFALDKREKGMISLTEMLTAEVGTARTLITEGNEHFYVVRDDMEGMGKRHLVDEMVRTENHTPPLRTNDSLVLLLMPEDLKVPTEYLGHGIRSHGNKNTDTYTSLAQSPGPAETGLPFLVVSGLPLAKAEIQAKYPSATVLYLAQDEKNAEAMNLANPDGKAVVIPASSLNGGRDRENGRGYHQVGAHLAEIFFRKISQSKGKGIKDMHDIVRSIATEVSDARDKILFSASLRDYYHTASTYYTLQETYRALPLLLQMDNPVMMETCPTGGCFDLRRPDQGGCCGGGNLPGVLIDFAIAYRKQVGEQPFLNELKAHHKGTAVEPWYLQDRDYRRAFKGLPTEGEQKKKGRLIF